MYRSKQEQKGSYRFFEAAMEAERVERRRREEELRSGIAGGEVQPFYQPIVRFSDDHLCGFEILARWHHPKLGILPPSEFIQLAENTRQITALTDSVLRQACHDIRSMPSHLRFAINLSPTQLAEPEIAERLISIVQNAGIEPRRIEIELTEDAIMDDVQMAEVVIGKFRDSGMSIALDDFRTGFSSLSNLRKLRFDKLKIDRSFVQTITVSEESQKLVDAILSLAASFNMTVRGRGHRDPRSSANACSEGLPSRARFFFSKPLPFSAAHELSKKRNLFYA